MVLQHLEEEPLHAEDSGMGTPLRGGLLPEGFSESQADLGVRQPGVGGGPTRGRRLTSKQPAGLTQAARRSTGARTKQHLEAHDPNGTLQRAQKSTSCLGGS